MFGLEFFNKGGSIAATDDASNIFCFAEELADESGAGGEGGIFGLAEQAVPDDGFGVSNNFGEFAGRKGATVELFTGGVFVEIFGDVDFLTVGGEAIGGDFATDEDMVGKVRKFVD